MVYELIPTKLSSIIPYIPYNTAVLVFPRFRAVVKHLSVVVRMAVRCYAPASESSWPRRLAGGDSPNGGFLPVVNGCFWFP